MSSNPWTLTGNAGTNSATNFIGTSDNQPLVIKTNGTQRALIDTNGNLGVGTAQPRSQVETEASSPGGMGPALTLTNNAADSVNQSVAIDLNTFPPPATVTTHGTIQQPPKIVAYNPSSRIMAQSAGNFEADIIFSSNNPGAPNNGLSERMRITPGGATLYGTLSAMPQPVVAEISTAGVAYPKPTVGIGIGTTSPRSALEVSVNASSSLGPVITLTNTGGNKNAAAGIDFNSFTPASAGTYNPSSRIEVVDDGNYTNDIVFLSNKPGAPNNGLLERMRISSNGVSLSGVGNSDGTVTPTSLTVNGGAVNVVVSSPAALGPVITLTNTGGNQNAAAAIDLNTYSPSGSGTPLGSSSVGVYNPSSRIEAVDDGNYSNDIVFLTNAPGKANGGLVERVRITANGMTLPGDIILTGADCAEYFHVVSPILPEPGTVLVIDKEGSLRESSEAYDKKVAGVVSGAGEYRHGILLDGRPSNEPRVALALTGKVYCKVDAQYSPIEVGDMLTTSPTPGHAMKATEAVKAFGSVIGKALRPLAEGQGLVPILVSLQ